MAEGRRLVKVTVYHDGSVVIKDGNDKFIYFSAPEKFFVNEFEIDEEDPYGFLTLKQRKLQ